MERNRNRKKSLLFGFVAPKMGGKYGQRCRQHFRDPDIREFDMKHEIWLYDTWRRPLMDMVDACMEAGV